MECSNPIIINFEIVHTRIWKWKIEIVIHNETNLKKNFQQQYIFKVTRIKKEFESNSSSKRKSTRPSLIFVRVRESKDRPILLHRSFHRSLRDRCFTSSGNFHEHVCSRCVQCILCTSPVIHVSSMLMLPSATLSSLNSCKKNIRISFIHSLDDKCM